MTASASSPCNLLLFLHLVLVLSLFILLSPLLLFHFLSLFHYLCLNFISVLIHLLASSNLLSSPLTPHRHLSPPLPLSSPSLFLLIYLIILIALHLLHPTAGSPDLASLHRAQACCRAIVQAVDERVGQTEHQQRLHQYLRRLDASPQFKVAVQLELLLLPCLSTDRITKLITFLFLQSLDLSTKRLIHEGSLTWKINKDKRIGW